ncbi:hypothetical protein [Streptomyces sp. NPDC094149]|uniref:hypothetical protein n=1 Tax=Streptomyces sp. NPDC094149 TaxID=3155079 RepID=UPI00331F31C9
MFPPIALTARPPSPPRSTRREGTILASGSAASLEGRLFADPAGLIATLARGVHRHTGDGETGDMAMLAVRRHAR